MGVTITAGIAAHHFSLTDELFRRFDSNCKANPPLRSAAHVEQCVEGLVDDTLDVICSGHSPRAHEKKIHELDRAPFGINGLETALGLVTKYLIHPGHLTWLKAIEKLSLNPARILGLKNKGHLTPGADADLTILDPQHQWRVDPKQFFSHSQNTPLAGMELLGRADLVLVDGAVRFDRNGHGLSASP